MKKIHFILLTIASLILFIGCNTHEDTHEVDSHHKISVTQFTDHYELFMEYNPLVAGEPSSFIIHITRLSDYKPVKNEAIELEISGKELSIKRILEQDRPGIYLVDIEPEKASGKVMMKISFQNPEIKDVFEIKDQSIHAEDITEDESEHDANGDITFLKEQAWKTDFALTKVERKLFPEVIKVSGTIQSMPVSNNFLIASSRGILKYEKDLILPGQSIHKGDILFSIEPGNLAGDNLRVRYVQIKADYEKAKEDFIRAEKLVKDHIISQREFAERKSLYEKMKAEYESISQDYNDNKQFVRSPVSGMISRTLKENGSFVDQGEVLAEILNTDQVILKADIPQKYLDKLGDFHSANFSIAGNNEMYNTDSLNAEILSANQKAIIENYYLPVYFRIDNPGDMIPGSLAEIYLQSGEQKETYVIPVSAIMESEGTYYVYVQESGEIYQRKEIKIGGSDGLMAAVESGLNTGDYVVSKGAYRIKLASGSKQLPSHGHVH